MSATRVAFSSTYTSVACCQCGVTIWIEDGHHAQLRASGASFFCVNGHSQHFAETTAMKLQKELDAEKRRHEMTMSSLKSEQAARGRVQKRATRAENKLRRVQNGVCPECCWFFGNLARHMETQHPEAGR